MVHHHSIKHHHSFHDFISLLKPNAVLVVAFFAAAFTSLLVPPDASYLNYFDYKTLSCLFATLAIIGALRNIHFFEVIAEKIVAVTGTTRKAVLALLGITFLGSMLIANDMALITFLPLGYLTLTSTGKEKYICFTFIMQNIAANLGGMLTPFGNPQNLYLYNKFNIPTGKFMSIMLPPFLLSITILVLCCFLFVKNDSIAFIKESHQKLPLTRTLVYLLLFSLSIFIVFRIIAYGIGLILIVIPLLFIDRKALKEVDYALLLTFICFFIFAGNMSRMDAVNRLLSSVLNRNPLLVSTLSCQFISNVPSAILLSEFTTNYQPLLLGVNIGGTGTLIASLASLITYRQFVSHYPGDSKKYLLLFSALNFTFLGLLYLFCFFL